MQNSIILRNKEEIKSFLKERKIDFPSILERMKDNSYVVKDTVFYDHLYNIFHSRCTILEDILVGEIGRNTYASKIKLIETEEALLDAVPNRTKHATENELKHLVHVALFLATENLKWYKTLAIVNLLDHTLLN